MKKVGIFYGGISPEHDVSIESAKNVLANINRDLFEVVEIFIDRDGSLWTSKEKEQNINFGELKQKIDIAFPVLHGIGGEDGSIQGLLQMLSIPFVGCDIAASAICLDKDVFNRLMQNHGIQKPKFVTLDYKQNSEKEIENSITEISDTFIFPVFVKPARTGSSVGVSKVENITDLQKAIEDAKQFDDKVIVEEAVQDCSEIEVSILGNNKDDICASRAGKVIPGSSFYDYDDKYKNDVAQFEIPTQLPAKMQDEIEIVAKKAYIACGCTGLARVDFLVQEKTGRVFLNEINTMPGFTKISMYPKLWEASGLPYSELITELIQLAQQNK